MNGHASALGTSSSLWPSGSRRRLRGCQLGVLLRLMREDKVLGVYWKEQDVATRRTGGSGALVTLTRSVILSQRASGGRKADVVTTLTDVKQKESIASEKDKFPK